MAIFKNKEAIKELEEKAKGFERAKQELDQKSAELSESLKKIKELESSLTPLKKQNEQLGARLEGWEYEAMEKDRVKHGQRIMDKLSSGRSLRELDAKKLLPQILSEVLSPRRIPQRSDRNETLLWQRR